jgi:signal transduction histidine kinase
MMGKARYLQFFDQYRSLRAHAIGWIILPLALIVFGMVTAGILSYRHVVVQMLINHQTQVAAASATGLSQGLESYTLLLESLASNLDVSPGSATTRTNALDGAARSLEIFSAGVILVDQSGNRLAQVPSQESKFISDQGEAEILATIRASRTSAVSSSLVDLREDQAIIIIAVPIVGPDEEFIGALLGGIYLGGSRLVEPLSNLVIGEQSSVYLLDRNGQIIYHSSPNLIGTRQPDQSFVHTVLSGDKGGLQWTSSSGGRYLIGYAPVASAGWGLVLQEPWEMVTAPARNYGFALISTGVAAFVIVMLLGWMGVRRIVTPIRALSEQARQLATVDGLDPIAESGISEIDSLEHSFEQMASQIASYRIGLRRYVGAITHKQEEEQRHIARELHDETVQSLLAISRSVELEQASERDPQRLNRLADIQKMVLDTLAGVRQISRDLRPLVLEDLGLIPALQALVRSSRVGPGAIPHIKLEVPEKAFPLNAQQELALYRIIQEALTNARKHAQPTGVRVSLSEENESIYLEIEDDGEGFTVPDSFSELAQRGCFGLMGIQERVWEMGGNLQLRSAPGEGTCLQISMPLIPIS